MLLFVFAFVSLAPPWAVANPIPRCQHLLDDGKDRVAQIEMDTYARLRAHESTMPERMRGLLLAVYESDLDDDHMDQSAAYSYVPAVPQTVQRYIQNAVEAGLLLVDSTERDARLRTLRPGPRLTELIRDELTAQLERIYEDARQVPTPQGLDLGSPPMVRSEALDRLLIRKMWSDFEQAWQTGAPDNMAHLRHTYGLLLHLYRLHLGGLKEKRRFTGRYIPLTVISRRSQVLNEAINQGLIEEDHPAGLAIGQHLTLSRRGIDYVEGRINAGIDRTNAVLRRANLER